MVEDEEAPDHPWWGTEEDRHASTNQRPESVSVELNPIGGPTISGDAAIEAFNQQSRAACMHGGASSAAGEEPPSPTASKRGIVLQL